MTFFTNSYSSQRRLLGWKQGGEEEEWAEKAIDSLVKKLKKKTGALEELEKVLATKDPLSKCITIQRSLDGRLQVSHRKGLPHVIYCRVWRWPDLQTHHELTSIPSCQFAFSAKLKEICINPYHYQRVENPVLPPVLVPKQSEFVVSQSLLRPDDTPMDTSGLQLPLLSSLPPTPGIHGPPNYNSLPSFHKPVPVVNPGISMKPHPFQTPFPSPPNPLQFNGLNNHVNPPPLEPRRTLSPGEGLGMMPPMSVHSNAASPLSHQASNSSLNEKIESGSEAESNCPLPSAFNSPPGNTPRRRSDTKSVTEVPYEEPDSWCFVRYFELNQRIGETFTSRSNAVIIDGFTDPTNTKSTRFCLGSLSNINRNSTIEEVRRHIGKGCYLYYVGGEVYAECLSDKSIFIQSKNLNHMNQFADTTVCKIPPKCALKVFNNRYFAELLSQRVNDGYEAVDELTKMCEIKVSFVKGWGADYQRKEVTSTPCWIEVKLSGPLQWLDRVLQNMQGPQTIISSMS